jgi:hypothetical protein
MSVPHLLQFILRRRYTGRPDLSPGITMHSSLIATDSSKSGTPKWVYCLAIGPATFLALLAAGQSWVPAWQLFVDPIRVAEVAGPDCCHVYYGFISNMGILFWCTIAACCLFAALLILVAESKAH